MNTGRSLGDFAVSATHEERDRFLSAIDGRAEGEDLPLTYPMRWLMSGEVRAALSALLPETDLIPFHEGQSFEYLERLCVGVPYQLSLTGYRASDPQRLIVNGVVCDVDGAICARLETTLRLFSAASRTS